MLAPERLWLSGWEKTVLWGLFVLLLLFGAIVENRSAFLRRRMTDADCYFRAAWAVRAGIDIYSVSETNGWHYTYAPLLAIALVPLASPPPGADETGMLPYPVSVAIWYALSVGCLWLAVNWLAGALGRAAPERWTFPRGSRAWWAIRVVPILLCLMAVGRTLSRGQANMILLLLFCGMIALLLENRRFLAGLCLAGAICIKVFPAFLILHAIVRRDFRFLAGVGTGLLIGLVLVPLAVMGPERTAAAYRRFDEVVLRPGLRIGPETTQRMELTNAADSQAFMALLRNYRFPARSTRPQEIDAPFRAAGWAVGALLAGATLAVGMRSRQSDPISAILFLGTLIVIMLPISPACHVHYFVFALPLVLALVADAWERHSFPHLGSGLTTLIALTIAVDISASLPVTNHWLMDFGLPLYATLALWVAGIVVLRKRAREGRRGDYEEGRAAITSA